jgi:hypothetical protein
LAEPPIQWAHCKFSECFRGGRKIVERSSLAAEKAEAMLRRRHTTSG